MKNKKLILGIVCIILLIIVIIISVLIYNNKYNKSIVYNNVQESNNNDKKEDKEENMNIVGKHHIEIKIKDYGTIALELDADNAPITVENFMKLAKEGFYDGLTFHRIVSGFMIQGGDPLGNGTGGSDKEIKGEFASNGVQNEISHKRGVISMARSMMPNSASSQFFIVHEDSEFLDGQYAAFGKVTNGIEIVDKICQNTKVEWDGESVAKENQPIIETIKVID